MQRNLRLGLLALPLSAWSVLFILPWRGDLVMPQEPGWSAWVLSDGFNAWIRLSLNATVWLAFGVVALYHALPGMAPSKRFLGCALLLAGTTVWLPVMGVMAWAWPQMDAVTAAAMMEDPMVLTWLLFAALTSAAGLLVLAWGTWDADRIVAAGFALGALAYVPGPTWFEIAAGGALAIAFSRLAWAAWEPVLRRATRKPA